jgi:hypothetical protein
MKKKREIRCDLDDNDNGQEDDRVQTHHHQII